MKKIILSSISLILVAAITIVAFAATTVITNPKMDDVLNTPYDDGAKFLKSDKKAPAYKDENGLKAVDSNTDTVWEAKDGTYTQYNFVKPTSINNIHVTENGQKVRKFHVEAWTGDEWIKVYNNELIEGYYCATIENIKTQSIRLFIDATIGAKGAQISEFKATFQRPVEYDKEFINMGYLTSNMFYQQYNTTFPKQTLQNLTDIYLIGNFCYDKDGNFVITQEKNGDNAILATYPSDSKETEILMNGNDLSQLPVVDGVSCPKDKKGFLPFVKSQYDTTAGVKQPDMWITLTCLQDVKFNGISAANMTSFNDLATRTKFINEAVAFCKKFGLKGADIDWEYPGNQTAWNSYAALIKDMSVAFHKAGLLLSSAQSSDMFGLSGETLNYFDRINMMSYDQNRSSSGNHSTYQGSTIDDIKRYIDKGVVPEKLVLGLAWYSSQGQQSYKNIKTQMEAELPDGVTQIDPGENFFKGFTFNGVNLIKDRTLYAIKRKIGGVFAWQLDCDTPYEDYGSLARAQDETIAKYVTPVAKG